MNKKQIKYRYLPSLFIFIILRLSTAHAAYLCSTIVTLDKENKIQIYQSDDAGDFYCGHAYCASIRYADYSPDIGVDKNSNKLVGFLHVPPDSYLEADTGTYLQSSRHFQNRFVVAAAIHGYFKSLVKSFPESREFKLLLTGFDRFTAEYEDGTPFEIPNNPTQDFVRHSENIESSMEIAFKAKPIIAAQTEDQTSYVVFYEGSPYLLTIKTAVLTTDDHGLNKILTTATQTFKPNAIISTGVGPDFRAEIIANDAGLKATARGEVIHLNDSPATFTRENKSLWDAISDFWK